NDRLAMRDSIGEKFGGRGDGEVTRDLPPEVVELIRPGPDIGAGSGDFVLPGGIIELGGTLQRRRADVVGISEGAELSCLSQGRSSYQAREQQTTHAKILPDPWILRCGPVPTP